MIARNDRIPSYPVQPLGHDAPRMFSRGRRGFFRSVDVTGRKSGKKKTTKPSHARVIVADDEAIIRMGLQAMLRDAGHEVVGEAVSADEVFELVERTAADVVLLDVKMPGMNAIDAARRLWQDFALPIVFVTGFGDQTLIGQATDAGAFAYVVKPVREEQLIAAIAVAQARWADLKQAREALETRKLMERAKGILMKRYGIGEEEAHLLLHRQSRNLRISMHKVAEALLASEIAPQPTPAGTSVPQTPRSPSD